MTSTNTPTRGDIWNVEFDRVRTVIVVSSSALGEMSLRIVVPILGWRKSFERFPWIHRLEPSPLNGLKHVSGADSSQVKSVFAKRLEERVGAVTPKDLQAVADGIALCIEAQ